MISNNSHTWHLLLDVVVTFLKIFLSHIHMQFRRLVPKTSFHRLQSLAHGDVEDIVHLISKCLHTSQVSCGSCVLSSQCPCSASEKLFLSHLAICGKANQPVSVCYLEGTSNEQLDFSLMIFHGSSSIILGLFSHM